MRPTLLCCCLLALVIARPAAAQLVQLGSVAPQAREAIRTTLAQGLPPAPAKSVGQSAARFRRAENPVALGRIAAGYSNEAKDREGLVTMFRGALGKYDEAAAESGIDNDMAASFVMLFAAREQLAGRELATGADERLAFQLQAALDTSTIAALPDAEKQAVYEWNIATAAIFLAMHERVKQGAGDPEHRLAAAATETLVDALGLPAASLQLGAEGLPSSRSAAKAGAPPPLPTPRASKDMVQLAAVTSTGSTALRQAFARGLQPAAPAAGKRASAFRRDDERVVVEQIVAGYAKDEAERAKLAAMFEQVLTAFAARVTDPARRDDVASGLAVLLASRQLLVDGQDIAGAAADQLTEQLQACLDTAEVRKLSSIDKQAVQEWALCTAGVLVARQQQAGNDRAALQQLRAAADELVGSVFAVAGDTVLLRDGRLEVQAGGLATSLGAAAAGNRDVLAPKSKVEPAVTGAPLPAPEVGLTGRRQQWQDWSFQQPLDWQGELATEGWLFKAPKTNPQAPGFTFLCLMPLQRADGDPFAQGLAILTAFFRDSFGGYLDYEFDDRDVFLHKVRGVTADGWPYVLLRLRPLDLQGNRTGHQARILLFQLGNQVAPLVGFQNVDEPTLENVVTGKCVAFPLLFHSIAFPHHRAPGRAGWRERLLGTWHIGSGTMWIQEEFKADGSYQSASAYRTYTDHDATQVLERTTSWFGEGRFVVQGDQLSVWPAKGKPRTNLFRIVEEANSQVPGGWLRQLYRLSTASDGSGPYESRLVFEK